MYMADRQTLSRPSYSVGMRVYCRWRDGQMHPIEIIEVKPAATESDGDGPRFYAHYSQFDRRLDEWVSLDRLGDVVPESTELETDKRRRGVCAHMIVCPTTTVLLSMFAVHLAHDVLCADAS